jgi:hypothetical protein
MTIADGILIVLAAAQLIYAGLTFHRDRAAQMQPDPTKRSRRPFFIIGGFMILTWLAAGIAVFDNHRPKPLDPTSYVVGFGELPGTNPMFDIIVYSKPLLSYRNDYKLMLIVRRAYANRDRMTDDHLTKSDLYTIDGSIINLVAAPSEAGAHLNLRSK